MLSDVEATNCWGRAKTSKAMIGKGKALICKGRAGRGYAKAMNSNEIHSNGMAQT